MRFYTILLLLAGYLVLPSTFAATNCLSYLNKSAAACLSYRYDTINAFFKDDQGIEHQVDLHRVLNAEQQILHVDFDFFANEAISDLSKDEQLQHIAWAFREAVVNQQLYTKRWRETEDNGCGSANQVCCKDGLCNDLDSASVSAVNLNNHFQKLLNGNKTSQYIAQNQQAPTRFHFTGDRNQSTWQVCMMGGDDFCEILDGNISVSDTSVSALFVNVNNTYAALFLDFLMRAYNTPKMICTPNIGNCSGSGTDIKCEVRITCSTP